MKNITKILPERIRYIRKKAGLTQKEAAALIDVSVQTWYEWERGNGNMHLAYYELFLIETNQKSVHESLVF